MAKPQQRLLTPKVYEVGVDITQERVDELVLKLADWFAEMRPGLKEPTVVARQKIKDCLEGKTSDGEPWYSAGSSTFATRIKMACRFDIESMEGIKKANEAAHEKRAKKKAREVKAKLAKREDTLIPDELRVELRDSAKYGDNPQVFLSSAEETRWLDLKRAYQEQFPELTTINAEAELNKLLNLLIVDERQQMKLLQGKNIDVLDMKGLTDQIVALKKALNIHPEQTSKRAKDSQGGNIAELVARFESMPNWRELRERFFTEELLQIFQMMHSPSPREDSGGFQLDEAGLFALTRCRTCHCSKCGTRNVAGFSVEEIEDKLVKEGLIQIEPRKPKE